MQRHTEIPRTPDRRMRAMSMDILEDDPDIHLSKDVSSTIPTSKFHHPNLRITISPTRRLVSSHPASEVRTPLVTGSLRTSPALSSASSAHGDRSPMIAEVICVVDPASRKLEIPRSLLQETQVLNRVGIPSLCMLFLKGKCRAGTRCHQAHVDPHVVEELRAHVRSAPTCCHEHGDIHSKSLTQQLAGCRFYLAGQMIPINKFAATLGLQRLASEAQESAFARRSLDANLSAEAIHSRENEPESLEQLEGKATSEGDERTNPISMAGYHAAWTNVMLAPRNVCRLHVAGKCRYVEECNHVHLCRSMPGLAETARRGESQRGVSRGESANPLDVSPAPHYGCSSGRFMPSRRRAGSLSEAHPSRILPDPTMARHPLLKFLDERHMHPTMSAASKSVGSGSNNNGIRTHNPYQYKVLNEYRYLSQAEVDKMVIHL